MSVKLMMVVKKELWKRMKNKKKYAFNDGYNHQSSLKRRITFNDNCY